MRKHWFRTVCIILVLVVTAYYLLPMVARHQYVVCNIEVFDENNEKIYEVNREEYRIGSEEFGKEFDNLLQEASVNDTIEARVPLPDRLLRHIEADIDFLEDQLVRAHIVEKESRSALPSWFGDKQLKLGLDLQGGTHLVFEVETEGLTDDQIDSATRGALEVIRNRIDEFGVAEPIIQRIGENRILVQLPGMRDPERAKELIGKTAILEFKLVAKNEDIQHAVATLDEYLKNNYEKFAFLHEAEAEEASAVEEALLETEKEADTTALDIEKQSRDKLFSSLISVYGSEFVVTPENIGVVRTLLSLPEIQEALPSGIEIVFGNVDPQNPYGARPIYFLYDKAELTGAMLENADVRIGQGMDPQTANKPYVSLKFNNEGARIFSNVTGQHVNERLAIVLDNVVYSAPVIQQKIRGGEAQITGNFTMEEARDLAIVLKAGNLPVPVNIIEERTVGPSLGSDSIQAGFRAGIIGLLIVVIFMAIYYKLSGLIADLALICNIFIILAVLTMLNATLTLPGIAGMILTIGMAVDANVLIFERIREELRTKKTVRTAIDNGYKNAIITIIDANVTTLITAIVLYQFGTGPIRGFAVTLSIGILASMFTAIILTRAIFDSITKRKALQKLSI
ncbi:MAG: protein translocase subunit SecD [Candidatus Cloacimonadia bacterium]